MLLPAAGEGREAISRWRAKTMSLASDETTHSEGVDEGARAQTHSGQMRPPAKKLEA